MDLVQSYQTPLNHILEMLLILHIISNNTQWTVDQFSIANTSSTTSTVDMYILWSVLLRSTGQSVLIREAPGSTVHVHVVTK